MATIAGCAHTVRGAYELLDALKRRGYRLFVVSNGSRSVQSGRLRASGMEGYFEQIFLSEDLGVEKPKREFFERCFAAIPHFDPQKAIILGDSLTSDMQGGLNAGILTCWFNPRGRARDKRIVPHFEIAELSEFLSILDSL